MTNRHAARSRIFAFVRLIFPVTLVFGATSACAQNADTIRQYQFEPALSGYKIVMKEVPRPVAGDNEVLVRVRATSPRPRPGAGCRRSG